MGLFKKLSSLFSGRDEKQSSNHETRSNSNNRAKGKPNKKKNNKHKKHKTKSNPAPKHSNPPVTTNRSIDSNIVFSNAYNTLDNFLQNLVNTKENTNLIWHLEQVSFLDDAQKSQLKTLRLYKNTIVSHGSVPGYKRPDVPYEWVVFLNDLYTLCLNNREQLRYELLSILRRQKKRVELPNHGNKRLVHNAPPCNLESLWTTFLKSAAKEILEYENYKTPQMQYTRCFYASGETFNSRYNQFGRNSHPMSKPCFDNCRNYAFYEIPYDSKFTNKGYFLFVAWDFHGCAIFGEMKVTNIYSFVPVGYYEIKKRQYDNYIRKSHYGSDCEFGNFRNGDNASLDELRRKATKVS